MKFFKKTKVFAYIFYVLAILYFLYTIFSAVSTIGYLSSVMSSGMYMDVGFSDMLTAFMGTVGPLIFYTFGFFFFGYAIQLISGDIIPEDQEFEESLEKTTPETETEPALTREPEGEETLAITEEAPIALEVEAEPQDSVEDVVSTIADVEAQVVPEETHEEEAEVQEIETAIAEEIDQSEPVDTEVEAVELADEED